MKTAAPCYTVAQLAEVCHGRLLDPVGMAEVVIRQPATLEEAGPDAVSWIAERKHVQAMKASQAAAIIGPEDVLGGDRRGVIVRDPESAIADILDLFFIPPARPGLGVHPSACVDPTARLGTNVAVGAFAVIHADARIWDNTIVHEGVSIGRGVTVGQDCEIFDRCVVYDRCQIGDRVVIHAGAVVGADGFGYIFRDGRHRKLAHLGVVIIEDDVEIGANTCIDRAKVGATRICRGSKIDDLVMIAHNVRVGPRCVIAGQTGLGGSVRLGAGVALGGQVGISHGIELGDGVQAAARSFIIGDIASGQVVWGMPARDRLTVLRDLARVRKLGKLFEEVAELRKRVAQLEAAANDLNEH